MTQLPQEVCEAWEQREGPVVLTTVDQDCNPNSIYANCVSIFNNETPIVADNYFDKTKSNILNGCQAALLFITKEGKSYQIKGEIKYFTEGLFYDDMKSWNSPKHPGHAAAALLVTHVFSGSRQLI